MTRMRIIPRLYDVIKAALWGGLAIWAVTAVWIIAQTPHNRAEFQRRLTDEVFEENRFYCTRWGFKEGTHEYNLCEIDLADIRAKAEERTSPAWP